MIESMPAAIAARNGGASSFSHSSRLCVMVGKPVWLSTLVSPCPGKCLAVAATPEPWYPATSAATSAATARGSAPKDRTPMTGLAGLTFTSATGE
ncbi:hypothetical protein GCM10011428_68920 [Streptomyces violaceus]